MDEEIERLLVGVRADTGGGGGPAKPIDGQCWIIGAGASGAWAGKDNCVALWCEGGWRFIAPQPGMLAWSKIASLWIYWTGTIWSAGELPAAEIRIGGVKVVGARQPHPPSPSGGTVIDQEARAAIAAITAALMSHGLVE
jgi:Protein of unknown function (DUF2793)